MLLFVMSSFILSQILVGIAICSDLISFQFKEKKQIVSCLLVSCTMISLHFVCLELWTAALLAFLAAIRFIASIFTTRKLYRTLFVIASVLISIFTYEGLLSILCTAGTIFGIYASFCKDDKPLRQLMAVGTSIWLFHNILAGSPGAVIMEIIFLSSNLVGYFRYYIKPSRQVMSRTQ